MQGWMVEAFEAYGVIEAEEKAPNKTNLVLTGAGGQTPRGKSREPELSGVLGQAWRRLRTTAGRRVGSMSGLRCSGASVKRLFRNVA
jgi:hypothetical protein